jgi:hypothetical protein
VPIGYLVKNAGRVVDLPDHVRGLGEEVGTQVLGRRDVESVVGAHFVPVGPRGVDERSRCALWRCQDRGRSTAAWGRLGFARRLPDQQATPNECENFRLEMLWGPTLDAGRKHSGERTAGADVSDDLRAARGVDDDGSSRSASRRRGSRAHGSGLARSSSIRTRNDSGEKFSSELVTTMAGWA